MNKVIGFQEVNVSAHSIGKKLYEYCKKRDPNITLRSYFPVNLRLAATLLNWEIAEVDGIGYTAVNECAHGKCDPKTRTISVDLNLSDPVKRYTIAHELGHVLLHEKVLQLRIMPTGRRVAPDPKDKLIEKQADMFAANLLMPRWAVTRVLHELLGGESLQPVSSKGMLICGAVSDPREHANALAAHSFKVDDGPNLSLTTFFGVSKPAMAIRLLELGCVT
jgi:Zn-dependent peptidase ImmA (M78 family)